MSSPSSKHPHLSIGAEKFIYKLESVNSTPLYELSPEEAREFLKDLQIHSEVETNADIEDKKVITDYGQINLRIARPKVGDKKLPAILYLHGGGWILGNRETHNTLICKLVQYSGAAVILPEYSLSPEYAYPTALEESFSVLKYMCQNAEEFNIDNSRVAIAGDSAGGNMAAVVSMMVKNDMDCDIDLKCQALFYPVTSADMNTKSYNEFKDGPWLTKKAMEWFWDAYVPDKKVRGSAYISPLSASEGELVGLPPALIITAENDVLRDEGEAYAENLGKAGVRAVNFRVNNTIHDFMMLNALYETCETTAAVYSAGQLIKHFLYS